MPAEFYLVSWFMPAEYYGTPCTPWHPWVPMGTLGTPLGTMGTYMLYMVGYTHRCAAAVLLVGLTFGITVPGII